MVGFALGETMPILPQSKQDSSISNIQAQLIPWQKHLNKACAEGSLYHIQTNYTFFATPKIQRLSGILWV